MMEPITSMLFKEAQVATSISRLQTKAAPITNPSMLKLPQMAALVSVGPTVVAVVL